MSKRPDKRVSLSTRQAVPGPNLGYLAEVMELLHRGEPLNLAQSRWTAELLGVIAGDVDPRLQFYRAVAHRPPASQELALWIATHIADCEQSSPGRGVIAKSMDAASREFHVGPEIVRRAWLAHKTQAREIAASMRTKMGADKTRRFIAVKIRGCKK